jgi:hypothetical protein
MIGKNHKDLKTIGEAITLPMGFPKGEAFS